MKHSKILEERAIISSNTEGNTNQEIVSDCKTVPVMLNAPSDVYANVYDSGEIATQETTVNKDLVDPNNNDGTSSHSPSQPDRMIDSYDRDSDGEETPTRKDIDEVDLEAGVDNTVECCHPSACCYICLGDFDVGECIAWSSNEACIHRFHLDCILEWLHRSGTRKLAKLLRDKQDVDSSTRVSTTSYSVQRGHEKEEEEEKIILMNCIRAVPYLCPLCRQDFISEPS
jgi:hypothetical protein